MCETKDEYKNEATVKTTDEATRDMSESTLEAVVDKTLEIKHETLPWKKRRSLVVWVYTLRPVRQLRKFGIIQHISKKMKYVVIYMDDVEIEKNTEQIAKLHFVREIDKSYRPDVATQYLKADEEDDGFDFEEIGTKIKLAEEV